MTDITEANKAYYGFTVADWAVFTIMLLLSALTGVIIAYRNRAKANDPERLQEYLTGNRKLTPFPVAMSLISSYISGVTILGNPSEIFVYGSQYWMVTIGMTASSVVVAFMYMPVFITLDVRSSYEYLELRFSKIVRAVASLFFLLDEMLFLPMVLYVPSLALNQVSGINIQAIGSITCLICVFYVYLGGLKAVVYTDMWQTLVMYISVVATVILGIINAGSLSAIFEKASRNGRAEFFNFNPSMYERYTIFSVVIGGFIYWTGFNSVNQTMVQRYVSLPTRTKANYSIIIFTVGILIFVSMCCFSGLLVYYLYADCDPLESGRISSYDQVLALYIIEIAGHLHGIPGLFISGVFGAALSSLSVILNSTAIVLLEDFFRGMCHIPLSERLARILSKVIIVVLGLYSLGIMSIIQYLGSIFEVATAFSAIAAAAMFGVFTLGMFVPWANTTGAIAGCIASLLVTCVIAFGTQAVTAYHMLPSQALPISVEKCNETYQIANVTITEKPQPDPSKVFFLFRLSYLWVTPIGFVTVMVVGIIASFLTGKTDIRQLDPQLISPAFQWILPKEAYNYAGTAVEKVKHQRLLGDIGPETQ